MAATDAAGAAALTPERVAELRRSLIDDGYCIVPGVWSQSMVAKVRSWSDELLDSPANEEWNVAWQGDVEFVQTPRQAVKAGTALVDGKARTSGNHSVHPIIEDIFDNERAREVCDGKYTSNFAVACEFSGTACSEIACDVYTKLRRWVDLL